MDGFADGRFLYTLNAGRGSIGMFRVSPKGRLVLLSTSGPWRQSWNG